MILLMFGPQGCGKGTQAKILSEKFNIPHVSTGDLFRSIGGGFKERVDKIINQGNLVPDELTLEILKERISKEDCKNGFILDGFPRNLNQAKELEKILPIDLVLEISIPDEESISRISGRRICSSCKAGFNLLTSPKPKREDRCDFCGAKLVARKDDTAEAVRKRLETYHKETEPVLEFYGEKVSRIQGLGSIDEISKRIDSLVKSGLSTQQSF